MHDGSAEVEQGHGLEIGPLTREDLAEVASVHRAAFPESELGRQGLESVRRSYLWQFDGPHDLTTVAARLDGRLVGFVFGGVFRGSTIGFIKREWRYLLGQALRHPGTLRRRASLSRARLALRLLVRRRTAEPAAEEPVGPGPRSFGILAIAVDPGAQGAGVGQALLGRAEAEARRLGFEQMHLTVHPDNERAVRFYELSGWKRSEPDGEPWFGQMVKPLG